MNEEQYLRLVPLKHHWIGYRKSYTAALGNDAEIILDIAEQITGRKYKGASCSGCLPECLQKCFYAFERYEKEHFTTEEFNANDILALEIKVDELKEQIIKIPNNKKQHGKNQKRV